MAVRKKRSYIIGLIVFAAALLLSVPARAAGPSGDEDAVIGRCETLLRACDPMGHTNIESGFGNLMADAMRQWSGADIALVPSGDLGNHLQSGDIRMSDLQDCLRNNSVLAVTDMTAAQLWEALEHSISHYTLFEDQTVDWEHTEFEGFLQVSGLHVTYNVTAPAGERIMQLTLDDGRVLSRTDTETVLSVVSTEPVLSGAYGYPKFSDYSVTGDEWAAARSYIQTLGTVRSPEDGGRIEICGARVLLAGFNARLIGGVVAAIGLLCVAAGQRRKMISENA